MIPIADILRGPYETPWLVVIDYWLELYCKALQYYDWTECLPKWPGG